MQHPRSVICIGDSLTQGVGLPELAKWPTRLAIWLDQWKKGEFAVYNRGSNGATSFVGLEQIPSEVSYLLPGLVLVAYGINDSNIRPHRRTPRIGLQEFKNSLGEIHRYVTESGGQVVFIAAHLPALDRRDPALVPNRYLQGNEKTYEENYRPYYEGILSVANNLAVPAIDIPAGIQARGLTSLDIVMEDGIHLSEFGNATYAELIFDALVHSQTCPE